MTSHPQPPHKPRHAHGERVVAALRTVFGNRLRSVVAYGPHVDDNRDGAFSCLALVTSVTVADLEACAARTHGWQREGIATPLLLPEEEFRRSLDAFPLEFGAIIADHTVVGGSNPFSGLAVDAADLRRAVEVQARSHLLHLREGYLETRRRAEAVAVLIEQSAPAFAALLSSLARLDRQPSHDAAAAARHAERLLGVPGGAIADVVALAGAREISSQDADRLFSPYLDAVERLVSYVDKWH